MSSDSLLQESLLVSFKYSNKSLNDYRKNDLQKVIEKYKSKIDKEWNDVIKKFVGIEQKKTSYYFFCSFAPFDLPIDYQFNSIYTKESINSLNKCNSKVLAILNEWTLLPVKEVPKGHRSIILIDFPDGIPIFIKNMPEVDKVTITKSDYEIYLCNT